MINIPNVITYSKMKEQFSNRKQYENWVFNNLKNGKIIKVRKDLYVSANKPGYQIFDEKYEIASAITETSFISHHSAIEFYGMSNQGFNIITVSSMTEFNDFIYEGVLYKYKKANSMLGVDTLFNGMRVTSLEKTIVDSIDQIDLAGGMEELVHFLSMIKDVNRTNLFNYIILPNKEILIKKCGFFLNIYKNRMGLDKRFFSELSSFVTPVKQYLNDAKNEQNHLDKKWCLIVPNRLVKSEFPDEDLF